MAEEQIQDIVDGIRTRFQAELDAQLGTIAERHAHAVDRARQAAEADAEQRWTARLESTEAEWALRLDADLAAARAEAEREWQSRVESTRAEWSSRLESEVAAARAEAERRLAAEALRLRVDAEQAAAETAGAARREMEEALQAERQQAQLLETERERVARELEAARAALDAERQRVQVVAPAAAGAADLNAARLLEAMRAIDGGGSLSDVLGITAAAAAVEAPRVAVFVANGPQLEEWVVPALPALSSAPIRTAGAESGIVGQALKDGQVHVSDSTGIPAPAFAALPPHRAAIAVPLTLGAQAVAVLYADEGRDGQVPDGWRDAIQILGSHASAYLAFLTAARTSQAMRLMSEGAATSSSSARSTADEDQGARRYARLLVSEIKLYNEAAVRVGREKRDLLRRLKPEIDRAHRLYAERIPPSVAGRDDCFQQELVQTLADGDPALLG